MNKIYAQSHGTFHAYQKKHGSKFTLTILAAALLVTFHTTTIASTTLASSTTPPTAWSIYGNVDIFCDWG